MRKIWRWAVATVGFVSITACGAPDLGAMRPSVWKASAELILVDNPPHWQPADVQKLTQDSNVFLNVDRISSSGLLDVVRNVTEKEHIGMCIIVDANAVSSSLLGYMESHLGTRYELVTTEAMQSQSVNVRQVVPSSVATGYALGWLTGHYAFQVALQQIGLITNGTQQVTRGTVESALAGVYASNTVLQVVPVSLRSLTTATTTPLPRCVIATRSLTATERQALVTDGVTVISLLGEKAVRPIAGAPLLPGYEAVLSDLGSYRNLKWHGGILYVTSGLHLAIDSAVIPSNLVADVNQVISSAATLGLTDAGKLWSAVPFAIRQTWTSYLQNLPLK